MNHSSSSELSAPDRLPSAIEAFVPPVEPTGVEVDPFGALTDREREIHQAEMRSIVLAQEAAVELIGFDIRPGRPL